MGGRLHLEPYYYIVAKVMKLRFSNKYLGIVLVALVFIGIGALISYVIFHKDSSPKISTNPGHVTINDTSAGLSFNMSKNFQVIPRNELVIFSGALYGFRVPNDTNTECIISQTKSGKVTAGQLRDGVFKVIKLNHANAQLDSSSIVQVGLSKGVLLQISYSDASLNIKRVEIAAVGDTYITFAFCQSLAADNPKYYNDFTTFFSSLKIQ